MHQLNILSCTNIPDRNAWGSLDTVKLRPKKEKPKRPPTTKRSETLLVGGWERRLVSHKTNEQDFPDGPVVRISALTAKGLGSTPGWGTKIPQAMQRGQK